MYPRSPKTSFTTLIRKMQQSSCQISACPKSLLMRRCRHKLELPVTLLRRSSLETDITIVSTIGQLVLYSTSCCVVILPSRKIPTKCYTKRLREDSMISLLKIGEPSVRMPRILSRNCWWLIPTNDTRRMKL